MTCHRCKRSHRGQYTYVVYYGLVLPVVHHKQATTSTVRTKKKKTVTLARWGTWKLESMLLFWPGRPFISEKSIVICMLPLFFCVDCDAWNDAALCISCVLLCFLRLLIVPFRKTERAATDARSLAGRRYRDACTVLAYVRCFFFFFFFFECCLYTSLLGTWWKIMMPGWCFSQLQLQGGLSAICRWTVLLFYGYCIIITIAPQGDALQKGTGGISTCCIAVCLFMGM